MKNQFEALNLRPTTVINDIRKSYKRLALTHHPDKGGDPQKFREIKSAHDSIITKITHLLELFPDAAGLIL